MDGNLTTGGAVNLGSAIITGDAIQRGGAIIADFTLHGDPLGGNPLLASLDFASLAVKGIVTTAVRTSPLDVQDMYGYWRTIAPGNLALQNGFVIGNLFKNCQFPNGLADATLKSASGVAATTLAGYDGAIAYTQGASDVYAGPGNFTVIASKRYFFTVDVQMDDLSAPVVNTGTTSATDFQMQLGGIVGTVTYGPVLIDAVNSIYRVGVVTISNTFTSTTAAPVKKSTHSTKGFKATNYQLVDVSENYLPNTVFRTYNFPQFKTVATPVSSVSLKGYSITCWGDSLTNGGLSTNPFPKQLGEQLSPSMVYNAGVIGDTSTQIKTRFNAKPLLYTDIMVIWSGRNNYASPDTVKSDIAAMVAALPHTNYIVMGVTCGNYANEYIGGANRPTIDQLNSDLATTYGSKFIDTNQLMVDSYNPSIPQDVIDHANGIPPQSLQYDGLHFNAAGDTIIATAVAAKIQALGYGISTGTSAIMFPAATNYLLASGVPATITTGSLPTGTYTLWMEQGTSATVSAGTATITGAGAATPSAPLTFQVTGAGTVTVTLSGTAIRWQLENSPVKTGYIATGTTTQARTASTTTFPTSGVVTKPCTLAGSITLNNVASTTDVIFTHGDTTNGGKLLVNNNTLRHTKYVGGVATTVDTAALGLSNGQTLKWAVTYNADGTVLLSAKGATTTDSSVTSTVIGSTMTLGSYIGAEQSFKVYRARTSTQMDALTW